jgi:predicted RNA binding protein YcfA (HicA-like mRNA interferase family)
MPKKIRELKQMLRKAGFSLEPAKGSHTKWSHPFLTGKVTLSGNDGDDAKTYQEKDVANAIQDIQNHQSGDQ